MKPLNVFDESHAKIIKIQKERGDSSKAKTVEYLVYLYEEQKFRSTVRILGRPVEKKEPGSASPIIDAEKLQNARK